MGEDAFLTEIDYESKPEPFFHSNNVDGVEEVRGEWELDDLVNDLHKEWSAHERKNEGQQYDAVEVEALQGTTEVKTESCKKQKNSARTILEPVSFDDVDDAEKGEVLVYRKTKVCFIFHVQNFRKESFWRERREP